MEKASYYKEKLGLTSHIEGGSFKEIYRSVMTLDTECLSDAFKGTRNVSTAIYFLLEHGQFSALHRIASDEMWHFYDGDVLSIYEITIEGNLITHKLGRDLENGESFQCVVKASSWFGSRCEVQGGFSLVSCTVAPGFDFADFELAERDQLLQKYPHLSRLISELT